MVLVELAIKQTVLTAESLQSLSLFTSRLLRTTLFTFQSNTTPAYLTTLCTFLLHQHPGAGLGMLQFAIPISRPHAILENERDTYTLTVGISLRVHSFQARVSGQTFVCREFRPIKLEYCSRVPNCMHAPTDGFLGYIKGVE